MPIKEGGGGNVKGVQKYFQRKKAKEKQESKNCNSTLRIRVFGFFLTLCTSGKQLIYQ